MPLSITCIPLPCVCLVTSSSFWVFLASRSCTFLKLQATCAWIIYWLWSDIQIITLTFRQSDIHSVVSGNEEWKVYPLVWRVFLLRKKYPWLIQTTLFIPTLDTTTKFVIMTIWLARNFLLRVTIRHKLWKKLVFNTFNKYIFLIFVRIASVRGF